MPLRYKVLLVDDEPEMLKVFKAVLEKDGFSVLTAGDAAEALDAAAKSKPDVVLTDVSMPDADGKDLCRRLRADKRTARIPVMMWSGVQTSSDEQLEGLDAGADDYLPKSTPPKLLAAKLRALLRRFAAPKELGDVLTSEGLTLDVQARTVAVKGKAVALTRKEFDLLTVFLRKPGQVLSANFLLETVWGHDPADYSDPRTVQTHLSSLRRKLGGALGERLTTVTGVGYRFDPAS